VKEPKNNTRDITRKIYKAAGVVKDIKNPEKLTRKGGEDVTDDKGHAFYKRIIFIEVFSSKNNKEITYIYPLESIGTKHSDYAQQAMNNLRVGYEVEFYFEIRSYTWEDVNGQLQARVSLVPILSQFGNNRAYFNVLNMIDPEPEYGVDEEYEDNGDSLPF
jgi:hypothetical protein